MGATASVGRGEVHLNVDLDYNNVIDAHFLRLVADEGLMSMHGGGWVTAAGADEAPGETIAEANYAGVGRRERLVRVDGAVVQLVFFERGLHVRVAAFDAAARDNALAQLRLAFPPDEGAEDEVPVRFWWLQPHGPEALGRAMPAPSWGEIAINYSRRTLADLEELMGRRAGPDAGGRLILWHGAPGTGKTTAIRALSREWKPWADFEFITDPERFLQSPNYLLSAIAGRDTTVTPAEEGRWRVVVLEDAGEFLAPDAKAVAGQALSRLLNVCDGALGQAMRALVLVTTNEDLRTLHPALSRPGRCLAENEFRALGREEIARWCEKHAIEPPPAPSATIAELFAHAEGRRRQASSKAFGFSAAAA